MRSRCRRWASPLGPHVRAPACALGGRRPPDEFPNDTYLPRVITIVPGIGEVGKTTVYIRAATRTSIARRTRTSRRRRARRRLRRDLDALHAPRLPGPLHRGCRAVHLPVPRRRLRLHRQGLRRPAGAPARPLLHPRARRPAWRSARATRSTPSSSASRTTATRRQPLDGIGQYLYPGRFSTPKLSN